MSGKRVKLVNIEHVPVISNGYGKLLGNFKVGKIIKHNSRSIQVSFHDDDGTYVESYAISNGVRVDDLGCSAGWRISPSEWEGTKDNFLPSKSTVKGDNGKSRLSKIHKGEYPLEDIDGNTSNLIVEVWEDSITENRYMRAVREDFNLETKRAKQSPAIVPFSILIKILADFESDWVE